MPLFTRSSVTSGFSCAAVSIAKNRSRRANVRRMSFPPRTSKSPALGNDAARGRKEGGVIVAGLRQREAADEGTSPGASRHPLPQAGEGTARTIAAMASIAVVDDEANIRETV